MLCHSYILILQPGFPIFRCHCFSCCPLFWFFKTIFEISASLALIFVTHLLFKYRLFLLIFFFCTVIYLITSWSVSSLPILYVLLFCLVQDRSFHIGSFCLLLFIFHNEANWQSKIWLVLSYNKISSSIHISRVFFFHSIYSWTPASYKSLK